MIATEAEEDEDWARTAGRVMRTRWRRVSTCARARLLGRGVGLNIAKLRREVVTMDGTLAATCGLLSLANRKLRDSLCCGTTERIAQSNSLSEVQDLKSQR